MKPARLALLTAAALLSGCASLFPRAPTLAPELQQALDTPLYCNNDSECQLMWERGVYFVANNSRWRIMAETRNLIETEYVPDGWYPLAYRITREPMGNGRYRIATTAWCGVEEVRCKPHPDYGIARAKFYMRTGQMYDAPER